jgi:acyl dehydratase
MRMAVDAYMGETATLTSPGVDQVRWLAPVRPDDVLSGVTEVTVARASASKPDRGIVKADVRIWNQNAIDVLTLTTTTFVMTRSGVAELDGSV